MGPEQSSSVSEPGGRDIAAVHRDLLRDGSLQFDVPVIKPTKPPNWLKPLADFLESIGPVLQVLFWIVVAALVVGILWLIIRQALKTRFGFQHQRGPNLGPEPDWRPTAAQAQVLLADADALADEGRYDEAAHLLLLRGVQDIRDQRPGLVRPALTSRDIAALDALPEAARAAFGAIAAIVERSLFGGRSVGRDGWTACRGAYEHFALGGSS